MTETETDRRADGIARTALLNCLVREVARPLGEDWLLPASGAVLRLGPGRWPTGPALVTAEGPVPLELEGLLDVAGRELRARTGTDNPTLADEVRDSRDVVAALLRARAAARPPADPYLRSEQALLAGHRYHPAPKTRGGGRPEHWLRYAPEAYAAFPLRLLGVPEELLAGAGDTEAVDRLWGDRAPAGYRVLPAHPWQLELLDSWPQLTDGRLLDLGAAAETAWATSSLRTVYLPEADLSLKFSLEVRVTNDIRRLWLRDLRWLAPVDELLAKAFADGPASASMLADSGYRTADLGGQDAHEAFAVLVREGFGPGPRPLLAAGFSEGFPGSPLPGPGSGRERALEWWRRYLDQVVPPVLHAYFQHGVVLECHLQNVLVGVDGEGFPDRVVFRDHEGVKLVAERHPELLASLGPDVPTPGVSAGTGWQRLQYCLLVNHLLEIAGALAEGCPQAADALWPTARAAFGGYGGLGGHSGLSGHDGPGGHDGLGGHGGQSELRALLDSPTVPAKTNLLLRWLDADGGDSVYTPLRNPLAG